MHFAYLQSITKSGKFFLGGGGGICLTVKRYVLYAKERQFELWLVQNTETSREASVYIRQFTSST